MATNGTTYYQLSQWLPEDAVLRADFNRDNAVVDQALRGLENLKADKAALNVQANRITQLGDATAAGLNAKGNCSVEFGTYVGNGGYGSLDPTYLAFSAPPALVLIYAANGRLLWLAPQMEEASSIDHGSSPGRIYVSWSAQGVRFYSRLNAQEQMNVQGQRYSYLFLRALGA